MKKFLLSLIALLGVGTYALADGLSIPEVSVCQGKSGIAALTLSVESTKLYRDCQFEIYLPAGITAKEFPDKSDATVVVHGTNGDAAAGHDIASNIKSADGDPQHIQYVISSTKGLKMKAGVIANIELVADPSLLIDSDELTGYVKAVSMTYQKTAEDFTSYSETFDDFEFKIKIVDYLVFDENLSATPGFTPGVSANPVVVKRIIKGGTWNTICLPFNVSKDIFPGIFGDKAEVAQFSGWSAELEGTSVTSITINFTKRSSTVPNTLVAGSPYLIKTSSDIDLSKSTFENVTLAYSNSSSKSFNYYDEENDEEVQCPGSFVSTYVKTTVPKNCLFIRNNEFYYSSGETVIKGFRGYFNLGLKLDRDSQNVKCSMSVDGEETAIDNIHFVDTKGAVYTVDGKYIGRNVDLKKLQKGIYVVDGKKIAIK